MKDNRFRIYCFFNGHTIEKNKQGYMIKGYEKTYDTLTLCKADIIGLKPFKKDFNSNT